MEIFKDLKDYEGHYQVSNLGRIKSIKFNKEIILKPRINNNGYYYVILTKKNKLKTFKVHQLVSIVFLNHKPCGMSLVINHINSNKLDNRAENLEITTQRENANKKHLKSSSEYVGVCFHKASKKWASNIVIKGKQKYLGLFNSEIEAHEKYQTTLNNI